MLNPLFIFFFPFFLSHCNSLHFIITGNFSSTSLDFEYIFTWTIFVVILKHDILFVEKEFQFIFCPPYAHFVLLFIERFAFSIVSPSFIYLHLRPHIRPFISTNIILLWYYIISSFYFHLIPDRPWGCILLLSLSFFCHTCIYIYICSTEIHRDPTKKQFHPYLLGIPLAKNMFFIPKDTYYKPWRAIIFSLPLSSSNTILFILESSRFIRTRDFHDYVRTKEKRISVKFW